MIPLDPLSLGIGLAVWLAFRKQEETHFGQLTPERDEVYRNALEYLHDPVRLRKLAEDFQKFGLKVQASMLRKRADWRGRTEEQKAAHNAIFERAMASPNIQAVLQVAKAFEDMTATVKASQLRKHVADLVEKSKVVEVKVTEVKKDVNGTSKVVEVIPRNGPAGRLEEKEETTE
jgi:hypothetical protein